LHTNIYVKAVVPTPHPVL